MTNDELKFRTSKFALRCVKMSAELPHTFLGQYVAGQLIRSSHSVAANYRATCLAQSKKEFISKVSIVLEEADESKYWIEVIRDEMLLPDSRLNEIEKESLELVKIFAASRLTARKSLIKKVVTYSIAFSALICLMIYGLITE
jgi:four helix bundle protein